MNRISLWTMIVGLGAAVAAQAAGINFDEIAASNWSQVFLTEEYAGLGIHFQTTDDGSIWDGMVDGDPGNWDLDGTNGPQFLGFNGDSYGLTATFDLPQTLVSLVVSRSLGSAAGDTFEITAYNGAAVVDTQTVALAPVNSWQTVQVGGVGIDRVVWIGHGAGYHPYGVDDLVFVPEPAALAMLAVGGLAMIRRRRAA